MAEMEHTTLRPGIVQQPGPLLETKLFVPAPRPDLMPRPRLLDRLDEMLRLDHKLGLLSASAGSGKTTLLASWVAGFQVTDSEKGRVPGTKIPRDCAVAWVSLDEGDNDPTRFLAYVASAMRAWDAAIGETILGALRSPQPPPAESLLTMLINGLVTILAAGDGPPRPRVLVLDDYHVIKAQAVHNAVTFLLDRLPPHMHLVLASRSDPPLPLARLRGRGQLTELRAADLRFTAREASTFLNQVMGLELPAESIAALEERTEGWITGLQLAALSLRRQDQEHIPEFVAGFAGSHRFVLDYLIEEVLHQQPEWVQGFLLQTSILDRLTGALCDAVTGRDDSQAILESLERENLFVVPLDSTREWYRYHHLFRDLLRARLNQPRVRIDGALEAELHRRASTWYEQNQFISEAIGHALTGRDFDRATDLIQDHSMEMLMNGELTTLLGWLAVLPEESIRARPWLSVYYAWALLLTGRFDAVEPRLQDAANASGEEALRGHAAAIRAYVAGLSGQRRRAIELAQLALRLLPGDDLVVRAVVSYTLGGTNLLVGNIVGASQAFAEASRLGHRSGNLHVAVPALCNAADLQIEQGQLDQAAQAYREALHWAVGSTGKQLPVAAPALSGLGQVLYERNDLQSAEQHLRQSIELGRQWGNLEALANDYGLMAWIYRARGYPAKAYEALQEAQDLAFGQDRPPLGLDRTAAYRARLDLVQGYLPAAAAWAREYETSTGGRLDFLHEFENLALARVFLAQGETEQASSLLAHRLQAAERSGRMGRAIEILSLQALACQAQGDSSRAVTLLERALTLAQPQGYVRTFIDAGAPMANLLSALSSLQLAPIHDYITSLLAVYNSTAVAVEQSTAGSIPQQVPSQSGLVESLTEREMEVLRLVGAGLTNQEIADALVIAISTVKSHTNSIYGKLQVRSRTQAVVQARVLGLLE